MLHKMFKISIIWLAMICSINAQAGNLERLTEGKWIHATSKNFDVVTDLDEEKARRMVQDLEDYRYFTINILKLRILKDIKPLKILAIGNEARLSSLGFPNTWAGVFTSNLDGSYALANVAHYVSTNKNSSFARQVLLHEYNHFLLRLTEQTQAYPTWYDEGIAEYLATFHYDGEKVTLGEEVEGSSRLDSLLIYSAQINIDSEKLMNTTVLPVNSDNTEDVFQIQRFYARSFFLMHYLNTTPELRAALASYLNWIKLGYPEPDALMRAFGIDHAQLDRDTRTYINRRFSLRIFSAKEGKIQIPQANIEIRPLDAAATTKYLTEVVVQFKLEDKGKNDTIVTQLLTKNLELNPIDADANYFAALNAQQPKTSVDYDELAKKNPTHARSLTVAGKRKLAHGKALYLLNLSGWEDELRQARDYFRRAINIDPQLASPYDGLGQIYAFLPDSESLQEGVISLDSASIYDRSHITFTNMANLLFRMNKPLDAIPVLRNALAFDPNKAQSSHAIIADNLEFLGDLKLGAGKASADGLVFDNGDIYQGAVSNGKPDGFGKITRPNGGYFAGHFQNGLMHGQGKLVTSGGYLYEGDFVDGVAHGKGKIIYPAQTGFLSYAGEIYFGLPHGTGTRVSKNGQFTGQFVIAEENGAGRYMNSSDHQVFNGEWRKGKLIWPEENNIVFAGQIDSNGRKDGAGQCYETLSKQIRSCQYQHGVLK
jgi:hypothetical protein